MFYHLIYPLHEYISFFNIFRYITVRAAFAAITAFIIAVLIGKFVINKLKKYRVIQVIREDGPQKHLEKKGTPTMGGILIFISFIISLALWVRFDNSYVYIILFSVFWFFIIGLIDDLLKLKIGTKGLTVKRKLFLQFLGSFLIILLYLKFTSNTFAFKTYINIPFIKTPFLLNMWIYIVFAMLVIASWSNAVNLTDGLDGLAAGLCFVIFITLTVLPYLIGNIKTSNYLLIMYVAQSSELVVVCAAMAGALLGFLWFNTYPAEVFMSDTGSLMLGGPIGTVAVLIKQEILLLIIGIIFVVEVLSVILQIASYKITKKRIFAMAPLHHHFQLKGISEPKIIIRFWIIAIIILLFTLSTLKLR
ncbi:MAG: phospho-N-acetylmuramoyl-pentapeptide-transferase [Candidatus Goldbacteria bacterium]|nr:phospho-N-acetylmuramoyl-pentapeptide-transferase [Candidatus Goldiibacteriota bacterium]